MRAIFILNIANPKYTELADVTEYGVFNPVVTLQIITRVHELQKRLLTKNCNEIWRYEHSPSSSVDSL